MKGFIFVRDLGKVKRAKPETAAPQAPEPKEQQTQEDLGLKLFGHQVKRFDAQIKVEAVTEGAKKFQAIERDGTVIDYKNVRIGGYLSVFRGPEASDRDGEYIEAGAYKETLSRFKDNPVMLRDHRNATDSIAGSFDVAREDKHGLYVEGNLSESPANQHLRFLVAEGHLKTLSIGGIFHYNEDGRGIFKVDLYEGSLVAVPADPDAIVQTRAFSDEDAKRFKYFMRPETNQE